MPEIWMDNMKLTENDVSEVKREQNRGNDPVSTERQIF